MNKSNYTFRCVDKKLNLYLQTFGAVCVEGPKWCGKTWTSAYHSRSEICIGNPVNNFQNRRIAQMSPDLVLTGELPRLIDEWQEVPPIWDAVRYQVDQNPQKGQFILTGSATPNHKGVLHSGAGRIARLPMRTMSLLESKESSGLVSLAELCKGNLTPCVTGEVDLRKITEYIIRGGWPASLSLPLERARLLPAEYLNAVIDDDVHRIDGTRRNSQKMRLLLRSLARNESTTVSNKRLKNDIREIDDEDIDIDTTAEYLDIFRRLFLIENQPPFAPNVRSSVRVKQLEKRHFTDPSLACAALGLTAESLLDDLETLGFLFEALCERDLRVYGQLFDAKLYHYQDYRNREIDAVLELSDGQWCAFEIKLGANQIDEAAANLLKIKAEFEADEAAIPPKILCVICGLSNAAYQRPDGVFVVPITALGM